MATPPKTLNISKKYVFGIFFFSAFIFLLYHFISILVPFADSVLASIALVLIFYPVHKLLISKLKFTANAGAFLSVLLVLFAVGLPIFFVGATTAREGKNIMSFAKKLVSALPADKKAQIVADTPPLPVADVAAEPAQEAAPPIERFIDRAETFSQKFGFSFRETVYKIISNVANSAAMSGGKLIKNFFIFVFNIIVMVMTMFLFFRDGEKIVRYILDIAPMDERHKTAIAKRLYETITAVIRGVILTAAFQGAMAGIGYWIAGIKVPVFLAIATAVAAVFPVGGATLVWLPAVVYVFSTRGEPWGIFLLIWSAVIVSSLDNFIRPLLIGAKAKLPLILLFLSLIGGIRVYGFSGILLGPLLIACVLAFAQIYREEFNKPSDAKPPALPAEKS